MTGVIDNMQSGCDQVVVEVVVLSVPPRYVHGLRGLVTMVTFTLSSLWSASKHQTMTNTLLFFNFILSLPFDIILNIKLCALLSPLSDRRSGKCFNGISMVKYFREKFVFIKKLLVFYDTVFGRLCFYQRADLKIQSVTLWWCITCTQRIDRGWLFRVRHKEITTIHKRQQQHNGDKREYENSRMSGGSMTEL